MVRSEQNRIGSIQNLVKNLSNPVELIFDLFCGTLATAKAGLEHPQLRSWFGCKVLAECFAASTEALIETYGRQALSEKSAFCVVMRWWLYLR